MKRIWFASVTVLGLIACGGRVHSFGNTVDEARAVTVDEAIKTFTSGGARSTVISGTINKVCQSEGCWFNYKTRDGELMVDFDHKFNIPKDSKDKIAYSTGYFFYDTTSVEKLREWAKDDNKD